MSQITQTSVLRCRLIFVGVMSDHLEAPYAGVDAEVDAGVEGEMGHFCILNRPPNWEALFGRWLRSTRHVTCIYCVYVCTVYR